MSRNDARQASNTIEARNTMNTEKLTPNDIIKMHQKRVRIGTYLPHTTEIRLIYPDSGTDWQYELYQDDLHIYTAGYSQTLDRAIGRDFVQTDSETFTRRKQKENQNVT